MIGLPEENSRQIKNAIIYLLPIVISTLVPILTLPIFTRVLSKEDYGLFSLAQVYAVFMAGIANFGLTIGYERNYFQYKDKAISLLYTTLLFVIFAFLILAALTFLFRFFFSEFIIGSQDHADLLFWSFCSTGMMSLKRYYLIYYKNSENAKSYVWYTIDETILGVIISIYFVIYLRIGIIGLVWGQLIASAIVFTALTIVFIKKYPVSFNIPAFKDSLRLSLPLTPRIFFGIIGSQFDKYMIGLISTVGGVGIYSIGQRIANGIFVYITAIHNVYSPQVYKRMFEMGEHGGESVGKYLTPFLYSAVAVGLTISLFSEEIVFLLTPKPFHGATDIIIILSMFYTSLFMGTLPQLTFVKKTYLSSVLSIVGITLNIAINIPFIIKWGATGAAWGTFLAGLISGFVTFFVSQHYYEIKWEYGKIAYIFLIFFGSSIAVILMRNVETAYGIKLAFKMISFSAFFYLGMRLDILNRKTVSLFKKMIFPAKAGGD
ncbi:MAG: oligosaccharide flippase family protein [Bacteroidetes bacterium]|nr:oligosaccharide flippase family protein [Bacteroidota bacterium]